MRLLAILSLLILVSCASPQKNPESYYAGTYAPSGLVIEKNEFVAHASVVKKEDAELAEKAAYLRLMKDAKAQGYRYFRVVDAGETTFIGTRYTVKGKLYKYQNNGAGVFELDAISRLLQGLSIEKPYVAPKPAKKVVRAIPKKIARAKVKPAAQPTPAPTTLVTEPDGPTVIMAPEDITGSIKKAPIALGTNVETAIPAQNHLKKLLEAPDALSDVPIGVVIK